VKRGQQKKEELKPLPPGQNSMEKRRATFKRDNSLPLSQKKDLDISWKVNRALFQEKVPHFVQFQWVTKNARGYLSTSTTPTVTAEMPIRYREVGIREARKVDAGIETSRQMSSGKEWKCTALTSTGTWERTQEKDWRSWGRNFRLKTRGWCCPSRSTWLEDTGCAEEQGGGKESIDGRVRRQR
jgi:hypothetical protein